MSPGNRDREREERLRGQRKEEKREHEEKGDAAIGLCADCRHMRPITSDRGSRFYLCLRAASDPRFPKYPRLPVLDCRGHERELPEKQPAPCDPNPDANGPNG